MQVQMYHGGLGTRTLAPLREHATMASLTLMLISDKYPETAIPEAKKNITIFADWFAQHGLTADPDTCSDSIMFYIGSQALPDYRTDLPDKPTPAPGYGPSRVSSFWGGPDHSLPSKSVIFTEDAELVLM